MEEPDYSTADRIVLFVISTIIALAISQGLAVMYPESPVATVIVAVTACALGWVWIIRPKPRRAAPAPAAVAPIIVTTSSPPEAPPDIYVGKLEYRRDPERLPDHWDEDTRSWVWFAHVIISNGTDKSLEVSFTLRVPTTEGDKQFMFWHVMFKDRNGPDEWLPNGLTIPARTIRNFELKTDNLSHFTFSDGDRRVVVHEIFGKVEVEARLRKHTPLAATRPAPSASPAAGAQP